METTAEKQTNIFEILGLIKVYWIKLRLWFLIALIAGIALGWFLYYKASKKTLEYYAQTTFMLSSDDVSAGGGGFGAGMGIMLPSMGGGGNKVILLELLKSHSMIERTLLSVAVIDGDTNLLINHYININGYRQAWANKPHWKNYQYPVKYEMDKDEEKDAFLRDAAIGIGATYVPEKTDEGIFKISFQSTNEQFTKVFIDNLIVTLIDYYTEKKTAKSRIIYEYAKRRHDELYGRINGQERSLAQMQDKTSEFMFLEDKVPQLKAQRDIGLSSGMLQEAAKSLAAASMSLVQETPFVQVIDDARYPLIVIEAPKEKKGIIGFLAGFFGVLAISAGFVIGVDYLRKQKLEYVNNLN